MLTAAAAIGPFSRYAGDARPSRTHGKPDKLNVDSDLRG